MLPQELSEDDDMTNLMYVGLDGEMTHTELSEDGKLCQIGVAFTPENFCCAIIGWAKDAMYCNPQSMAVHGISEETLINWPARSWHVDKTLWEYLLANGASAEKKLLIPIGFNVMAFDMPFVRDALPNSYLLFSRRGIDLNAVCFTMDDQILYEGSRPTAKGWKRMAKEYANEKLADSGQAPHDAGYDARQALYAWQFLRERIRRVYTGAGNA